MSSWGSASGARCRAPNVSAAPSCDSKLAVPRVRGDEGDDVGGEDKGRG